MNSTNSNAPLDVFDRAAQRRETLRELRASMREAALDWRTLPKRKYKLRSDQLGRAVYFRECAHILQSLNQKPSP